jgi:hypothetical protein
MTLAEIIARARLITDDTVEPYAFSDAEHTTFANRAVREACDRGGLIYAAMTIPLVAEQSAYALDYEVLSIDFAAIPGRTLGKLIPTDLAWLQVYSPSDGTPSVFAQREHTIEVYPTPDADLTLTLKLYRYPIEALLADSDEPEIDPHHHEYLAHWMAYEAFSAADPDFRNPDKAREQMALFNARFGRPRSALEIRSWRELPRDTHVTHRGI